MALCLLAAVLTLVGTVLPLFSGVLTLASQEFDISITSWRAAGEAAPIYGGAPNNGFPLVFGAVGLLAAGVTGLAAVVSTPSARRPAAVATGIAAAFLTGAVWTVIVQVANWLDLDDVRAGLVALQGSVDVGVGGGFWLLLLAAVLGIAAAVLWLVSGGRQPPAPPRPGPVVGPVTPSQGFAVPVILPRAGPPPRN